MQGTYNFFSLRSGKEITCRQFTEVTTSPIIMKRVAKMSLVNKQNEGIIFENRAGVTVNYILPYDDANKAFNEINRNIAGVE